MKILYVIESLTSGGKERRLVSLIKELLRRDIEAIEIIILSDDIHYKEIYEFDIKIHAFERNIKKDIRILAKFNKVLKKFNPDVVHCWDNIAAFHFGPICKIRKIPFINSMISTAPPKLSLFSKRYFFYVISYPFSDVILTNSNAGLYSYRVPKNKGKYIYNGFDFNRANVKNNKDNIRAKFTIETKYVVGMTGGFYDRKDYPTFVKAAEIVLSNRNDVTFIGIGGGPDLDTIKNSVAQKHKSKFRFTGKQDDVESIVNIFDIGVLATFTEGISNAIMEYMILEKPVIATDGGGTNELVIDNVNGFLVEQGNAKEIAKKIEFLLENPGTSLIMGKKGKERIKNNFSIDKMINQTIQLYKDNIK